MKEHPIQGLMNTAMQSIKDMVDVNTIVGDAVTTPDGTVIIPVSKVAFGFAAGGGEYGGDIDFACSESCTCDSDDKDEDTAVIAPVKYPFAGGSGAGVSINPVCFLVVSNGNIKLLPIDCNQAIDKLLDMVPSLTNKIFELLGKKPAEVKVVYPENQSEAETF